MSAAEQEAAAALRASAGINQAQQVMTEESRVLLAALLRDEMRIAVAEGIAAAMTDEAAERFWAKGLEVLQRQATERTGRLVLGGLMTLAKRLFWVSVFLAAIYSIGGWTAVKHVWAAISRG